MKTGASIRVLRPLLAIAPLRRRLALALRVQHFDDLDISIPLTHGLSAPLFHEDDRVSFAEIFLEGVYDELLRSGPLPARWLDLGCHAGYFSLWLEWQRRRADLPAGTSTVMLVDADRRRFGGLARLTEINRLGHSWRSVHSAIAEGSGSVTFYERGFMGSSTNTDTTTMQRAVTVPILTPEKILAQFSPPYDLIKVDIEGAEKVFFAHYGSVWREARILLIEWHRPQLGAGGVDALSGQLRAAGFARVQDFGPPAPDQSHGHILALREVSPH